MSKCVPLRSLSVRSPQLALLSRPPGPKPWPPRPPCGVMPVWFQHYQPRLGLADSLEALADDAAGDTMLALFAPPALLSMLRLLPDGRLDAARTLATWARGRGPIVTFGAYTAELEVDVAAALTE